MKQPLVYIAGPYMGTASHNADGYHDIDANIGRARAAAAWCAQNGIYFFCPHLNSAHFEVITPEVKPDYWYSLDLRILGHCDAMLVLEGWEASSGTKKEIAFCQEYGIPFFYTQTELMIWVNQQRSEPIVTAPVVFVPGVGAV